MTSAGPTISGTQNLVIFRSKGSSVVVVPNKQFSPGRSHGAQPEGPRGTKGPREYVQSATSIRIPMVRLSFSSVSRAPFIRWMKEEKKRGRKRNRGDRTGVVEKSASANSNASYRCHPFIAWSNSRRASLLPVNCPQSATLSLHLPLLRVPPHVKVNNTPTLCAPRRVRFLSKCIHDKFLFRGLNARARVALLLGFPFALALLPLVAAAHPPPPDHGRSPFLIFSSVDGTRNHAECHGKRARWMDFFFLNAKMKHNLNSHCNIYKAKYIYIYNFFIL